MKKVLKKVLSHSLKPFLQWYLMKERNYSYQGIKIKVLPEVFHPGFFFSTKILLRFLEEFELKNKTLLELGAGSGLISIWSAKQGAEVTASDISEKSIQNISFNRELNQLSLQIYRSDLFEKLPRQIFDFIIINPPYFRGSPTTENDMAWYAGENYEYFEKLFAQLLSFMDTDTIVLMILSEDCDLDLIQAMATQDNLVMKVVLHHRNLIEENFIFRIGKK